ncbi:MAG: c-type cytochrome [Burkholderiales bacterium]
MGQYGLRIPADEREKILQYLVTYLGPNAPKAAPPAAAPSPAVDGAARYARQCSACHQAQGGGLAGSFPPLAGNRDLYLDRMFPVYVLLNGLEGAITVKGESYNGVMPPFDHLSDAEIAAIIRYVRAAWNNAGLRPAGFVDVDEKSVAQARHRPMQPAQVYAYRAALRR